MESQKRPTSPAGSRLATPPSPSPKSFASTTHNSSNINSSLSTDDRSSLLTKRPTSTSPAPKEYESSDDNEYITMNDKPTSVLLPMGSHHSSSSSSSPPSSPGWRKGHGSGTIGGGSLKTSAVFLRVLAIIILISLFPWFYLEALAGGDLEWIKDHLSSLGAHLVLSVVCLTLALSLIAIWQIPRPFVIGLVAGMTVILYALKLWDDGESFEMHGAYNMLVFLVIAVPLNLLIQSILCCHRKMSPARFRRLTSSSTIGIMVLATMFLLYYRSIWGDGANGARLLYGRVPVIGTTEHSRLLCEWVGFNLPVIDLLPNHIQTFWAGSQTCSEMQGIEAEWSYDGILTIECTSTAFKDSGASPTYELLPSAKEWPAEEKFMHTFNKKFFERVERKNYTEPVLVNSPSTEAIVAKCGPEGSKLLLRLVRQESNLERVKAILKVQKEMEQSTETVSENEMVDVLHGQGSDQDGSASRKPNVLILYMDAVSRRQFYRRLAKTASTIERLDRTADGGLQLHEFFRYHSVGLNTNDNTRTLYTNFTKPQDPLVLPIWKDFYEAGYITSRVEDDCEDWSTDHIAVSTSKYFDHELQAPFCLPPYYAIEGNPYGNFNGPNSIIPRCMHGKNVHKFAFEYMNQFRREYKDTPWFQMGALIEGHEGTGEVLLSLDNDMAEFIKGLEKDGTLENTIVFMMADHGLHMGINFMFTPNGRIEHMNPYLSMILPPSVTKKYPSLARGLKHNQQSLITAHEIHSTLKLIASGNMPEKGDQDEVDGGIWRRGTLFDEELNPARTCEEALVPEEFCRCRAPS